MKSFDLGDKRRVFECESGDPLPDVLCGKVSRRRNESGGSVHRADKSRAPCEQRQTLNHRAVLRIHSYLCREYRTCCSRVDHAVVFQHLDQMENSHAERGRQRALDRSNLDTRFHRSLVVQVHLE